MVEACSDLVNECKTLAQQLGTVLLKHQSVVATAESCTGGLIGGFITDISGSSSWFDRGFVTYTNKAKMECLGVKAQTLDSFGAVSAETANEMVLGALAHSDATIAVAVTGIAGPTGAVPGKPIGTVYFGFAIKGQRVTTVRQVFGGDREQVRLQTVRYALKTMISMYN